MIDEELADQVWDAWNAGLIPKELAAWAWWSIVMVWMSSDGVAVGHSVPHWISQPPIHEWYVALDLNFRELGVRAPWWNKLATVLDQIHLPLPGARLRDGRWSVGLY